MTNRIKNKFPWHLSSLPHDCDICEGVRGSVLEEMKWILRCQDASDERYKMGLVGSGQTKSRACYGHVFAEDDLYSRKNDFAV